MTANNCFLVIILLYWEFSLQKLFSLYNILYRKNMFYDNDIDIAINYRDVTEIFRIVK